MMVVIYGCSAPMIATKSKPEMNRPRANTAVTIADSSGIQKYEQEEALLAQILAYYEKIDAAHREGDLGLAETLIDSAFIAYGQVNLDEIADQVLVSQLASIGSTLAKEYGQILKESEQISQEDPESWIPNLSDAEQFKSGQWTYEELKTIVNKISRKSDIPIDFNEKVRNMIYFFQTRGRDVMTKWQKRSSRYIPMIQEIFAREGLPVDLAYLSMIESGFNPTVVSRARAVGLWQFIYTTGKLYGLERNEWLDERRDPVKSTCAAARHIKDLFKLYDDWNLVMAAYNCGAGRVARSLKSGVNDYWRINLPGETDNYVPTFMAALIISKAPEIFGFENIEKDPPFRYDTVEVRSYLSFTDAARCAGVDIECLRLLNSELLRDRTPAGKESYQMRIPEGVEEVFLAEYVKLPEEKFSEPEPASSLIYRVRSGDTLSVIARKYGVSVSALMSANKLKKAGNLKIGQKLTIPGAGASRYTLSNSGTPSGTSNYTPRNSGNQLSGGTVKYKVKKDDTLWTLANRYNTTVDALLAINNMGDSSTVQAGQIILVPRNGDSGRSNAVNSRIGDTSNRRERGSAETSEGSRRADSNDSGSITYIVQKNDSLYVIAQKYGVSYKDIMQWNKIKDHRKIKPGDRLLIKTKS